MAGHLNDRNYLLEGLDMRSSERPLEPGKHLHAPNERNNPYRKVALCHEISPNIGTCVRRRRSLAVVLSVRSFRRRCSAGVF